MQILTGDPSAGLAPAPRALAPRRVAFRPKWNEPRTPFRHTWEGIVNVDQFRWLVRRDMQDQLALAQRELGATDVRAVGMFDDEMRAFCPSPASFMGYEAKDPRTNFQIIDYVMDSLLDRGLRPMFTTSFIPGALAGGPVTVFTTKAHTSPPADLAQWEIFVREAVRHAVDRYSLTTVRAWNFEVWNEPNLHGWFWGGNQVDFHRLWQATYRAVKGVDAALRIGGPSTARGEWIEDFLAFAAANDCAPDYLISHIYNNDSTQHDPLAPFDGPQAEKTSKSPDSAENCIRRVGELAQRHGFRGEIHWNEWGRSFHAVDPRREDPSEAAFVARFVADVSQAADSFSYWCLSDIYDQVGYGREAFFGGYGLLSLQGLRKPAYHAFHLLSRLGRERVATEAQGGDSFLNAIVTAGPDGRAQVLVYAYDHADAPERRPVEVELVLPPNGSPGTLHRIDSTENNVVARWRDLGSPAYLSRPQLRELQTVDALTPSSAPVQVTKHDDIRVARFTMESPGVALLDIDVSGPLA